MFGAIIGNFDGVHVGHLYVVEQLLKECGSRSLTPIAITFDTHPRTLFDPTFTPKFLTTLQEKEELLRNAVGNVHILHFNKQLAALPAYDFMRMLRDEMGIRLLLIGYDNRFGKRNSHEGPEQYALYGKEIGIEVIQVREYVPGTSTEDAGKALPSMHDDAGAILPSMPDDTGKAPSEKLIPHSSLLRHLIAEGDIERANICLGRQYSITGEVVKGFQEGRKIGFPTANIAVSNDKLLPANGVYATEVTIEDDATGNTPLPAITNIGMRPTYSGKALTVETHIPNFSGDLYGKTLTLHFLRKIRDERPFSSPEELRQQIAKDLGEVGNEE